ncbi:MAG: hypothetical protein O7E54_12655 [Planctomycetota bacterium]|nr:hypothetical protein [Planctomycetota bacterium]
MGKFFTGALVGGVIVAGIFLATSTPDNFPMNVECPKGSGKTAEDLLEEIRAWSLLEMQGGQSAPRYDVNMMAWECSANPHANMSKSDLCDSIQKAWDDAKAANDMVGKQANDPDRQALWDLVLNELDHNH